MTRRCAASSDRLYEHGPRPPPLCGINYVASHDGFTLNDLVTYNHKHNEANGEQNCDGDNNNYSYNYGIEGPRAPRRTVEAIRLRQMAKNLIGVADAQSGRTDAPVRR